MFFKADRLHMYVSNSTEDSLISGYFPDTPTLDNYCHYFQGFYSDFKVDYTNFNESGVTYIAEGGDIEVCYKNTTAFPAAIRNVYVTDYLKKVTAWP